jgi:heat-inducible transcriptional repressor
VHTSSGRVPTERGYRYYVNHLMQVQQLTLGDRERIEQEFAQRLNDADQVLRQTTQLLALISHQAGIAEAPSQAIATLQRLDLMSIAPDRFVLLTADNFGRIKTLTVALEEPWGRTSCKCSIRS